MCKCSFCSEGHGANARFLEVYVCVLGVIVVVCVCHCCWYKLLLLLVVVGCCCWLLFVACVAELCGLVYGANLKLVFVLRRSCLVLRTRCFAKQRHSRRCSISVVVAVVVLVVAVVVTVVVAVVRWRCSITVVVAVVVLVLPNLILLLLRAYFVCTVSDAFQGQRVMFVVCGLSRKTMHVRQCLPPSEQRQEQ